MNRKTPKKIDHDRIYHWWLSNTFDLLKIDINQCKSTLILGWTEKSQSKGMTFIYRPVSSSKGIEITFFLAVKYLKIPTWNYEDRSYVVSL